MTLVSSTHQTNSCSAFGLHLQLEAKATMGDEELGGGNHVTTVIFINNSGIPSTNDSKAEFIKLMPYCILHAAYFKLSRSPDWKYDFVLIVSTGQPCTVIVKVNFLR